MGQVIKLSNDNVAPAGEYVKNDKFALIPGGLFVIRPQRMRRC